jgi:hypothetical protein
MPELQAWFAVLVGVGAQGTPAFSLNAQAPEAQYPLVEHSVLATVQDAKQPMPPMRQT